jgi:SAM-dependent methyltransferase
MEQTLSPFSLNWLVLRLSRKWIARALAQHGKGRLLDVGCGARPYRTEQDECARSSIGLEQDRGRYAAAPPQVWGSALMLPFRSASFDTVFSSQVLEHVPEPGQMVTEIARVLRSGGSLILTAPHIWGIHEEPEDYFRFTRYGLEHLARRAGMEPLWTQAMAGYWVTAGARFCHYLTRFGRGPLRLVLKLLYCVVQLAALALDRIHCVESDTWNYVMVARKP